MTRPSVSTVTTPAGEPTHFSLISCSQIDPYWLGHLPPSLRQYVPEPLLVPNRGRPTGYVPLESRIKSFGVSGLGEVESVAPNASISSDNMGPGGGIYSQYDKALRHASPNVGTTSPTAESRFVTDLDMSSAPTRYIAIEQLSVNDYETGSYLQIFHESPLELATEKATKTQGNVVTIYLFFEDIRDAEKIQKTNAPMDKLRIRSLTVLEFYDHHLTSPRAQLISLYEGQVVFSTREQAFDDEYSSMSPAQIALQLAAGAGAIRAIAELPKIGAEIRYRVEYYNLTSARDALCQYGHRAGGFKYRSTRVYVQNYYPLGYRPKAHPALDLSKRRDSVLANEFEDLRLTCPESYRLLAEPLFPTGSPNARSSRNERFQAHNVLDIVKVERGLDVRTTIMLRNIPNKLTGEGLKEFIDTVGQSFGNYDFFYLRIDFNNNCNVGYAFINFTKSEYIIPFYKTMAGRKWSAFNSEKTAEISYATIQGRDCLIQKFRNSSVMEEYHEYRPKLFHANGHELCGEEEPFPSANNMSKLRRSLDNAQTLGLFPPRRNGYGQDAYSRESYQRHYQATYQRNRNTAPIMPLNGYVEYNYAGDVGSHAQQSFFNPSSLVENINWPHFSNGSHPHTTFRL